MKVKPEMDRTSFGYPAPEEKKTNSKETPDNGQSNPLNADNDHAAEANKTQKTNRILYVVQDLPLY